MSSRGNFSSDPSGSAIMHGEFMAFVGEDATVEILRRWAERQGHPAATVQLGGPDMFAQILETAAPPKMAIIDIDGQSDPVSVTSRLISLCGPESKLIIIGSANDVSLYRRMLNAGAVDYLVKPLSAEGLNQALVIALRGNTTTKAVKREAKIIVMMGVRGGVGTSTTATNTGWILSHESKFNCALLDLDLQFGTTSLSLDLEPGRGLRDIVSSPHRVDSLMIASSMVPESDHFSVLGAEESIDEVVPIDSAAIMALLKEIQNNFDFIIVDLPRHMLATQKRLLTNAHEIVLVTELSLAGIRDTLRIKTALHNLGCTAKLTAVAARIGPTHTGQVNAAVFEKGTQLKIDIIIPEDHKSVTEAVNGGKALGAVARHAPVTQALRTLAHKLSGKTTDATSKGLRKIWTRIFGSETKKKEAQKERG